MNIPTGYTPAPWEVKVDRPPFTKGDVRYSIVDANKYVVAGIASGRFADEVPATYQEAHAQLIALAPEMADRIRATEPALIAMQALLELDAACRTEEAEAAVRKAIREVLA